MDDAYYLGTMGDANNMNDIDVAYITGEPGTNADNLSTMDAVCNSNPTDKVCMTRVSWIKDIT